MRKVLYSSIFFIAIFVSNIFFPGSAHAAILKLDPEKTAFSIGESFTVDVVIDSEDSFINAAQATLTYPQDIISISETDRSNSSFNFWVEEPSINNDDGVLSFIGGTAKGVGGESLNVLTVTFLTQGSGTASLTLQDATVAASDGKGTNVLSKIVGSSIVVGTATVIPDVIDIPDDIFEEPVIIEQPQRVERDAELSDTLPAAPDLRVQLYPDENEWYNHIGDVIVLWELPSDVVQVSTRLSRNQDLDSGEIDDELFTGKNLGRLEEEGIWYVRAQFRNNVGWGEVAYYKISIDTTPPIPFEIQIESDVSDDPSPRITFETQDSLSGISHASILVDGNEVMTTTSTEAEIPPQSPAEHTVTVRVFDKAGNSVEDDQLFEVIPLPTPTINFVSPSQTEGELVFASGKGVPNGFVEGIVASDNGREVGRISSETDSAGNWELLFGDQLVVGEYTIAVITQDVRGAVSYQSEKKTFKVKPKPILSIGFVDIGWFEILVSVVLLVLTGISVGGWWYTAKQKTRGAYQVIAGRDVEKMGTLLENELDSLKSNLYNEQYGLNENGKAELEYSFKKMKDTISRMKKFIAKELQKLK